MKDVLMSFGWGARLFVVVLLICGAIAALDSFANAIGKFGGKR